MSTFPPEIQRLLDALDTNERDARALTDGLSEAGGTARLQPGSWSVAECLDHLATGHRLYIEAMEEPARRARARGKTRRREATPGMFGAWFVRSIDLPVRMKMKAPSKIRPRPSPPLAESFAAFMAEHARAVAFIRQNADLDLASIRFPNPFIRGVRFSLATGIHVFGAHERRHIAQAWNVRRSL